MFNWLKHGKGSSERRLADAAAAINKSRAAIEAVIGLPHVLSKPILQRRWGDAVIPSDESFAMTGKDGEWRFPKPHPDLTAVVKGDETGRLVAGVISGHGPFAGLRIFTHWNRFSPVSEWQVELNEARGELSQALYERLLGKRSD